MATAFTSPGQSSRRSRRKALPKGARVVVVGNGMVGARLCNELVASGLHRRATVTVIGAEPLGAYDRIHLSDYFDHRDAGRLALHDPGWHDEHGISLRLGDPVARIDRSLHTVHLAGGEAINYEVLILATGSRPLVPPIEGTDLPGVFLYRTIADLDSLIAAAEGKRSATIIGGGLLGLEAAEAARKLGLRATVVERASFLMPRQLTEPAGRLLETRTRELGIDVLTGHTTERIAEDDGALRVDFTGGTSCRSDLVIISAGIVPNSELAAEAGLQVGLRGGVVVNDHLETEDDCILAIGECALVHGHIYGLANPGYEMAAHVVRRLLGKACAPFPRPDLSTRLKMLGADVATIGEPLEEGLRLEFQDEDCYRTLTIGRGGTLKGALGVGPWPERGLVHELFARGAVIRERERERFTEEGRITVQGPETSVAHWPGSRIVCNCTRVTQGTLAGALGKCGRDPERLAAATGAGTVCGSCRPLLAELCDAPARGSRSPAVKPLFALSGVALLVVLLCLFGPTPPMAQSVESWWYRVDQFWRDGLIKQISGYSLLGICLIGLLFSLRKRFNWFRFGHFARWRVFHTAFGLLALVALFVHTGFRFGHNLNFWLMATFVGLNLLGAAAGVVSAMENAGTSGPSLAARRLRPFLGYAHLVLFWPLPVLVTFHILSVYLY